MTGRRLYEHYCNATAHVGCYSFVRDKTVLAHPDEPPVAWAFLVSRDRDVWNDLAKRVTPKRRPKPPAPAREVCLTGYGDSTIQAIRELRAFTGWGLKESKFAADVVRAGSDFALVLPAGTTASEARAALPRWTVRDA